MSAGLSPIERAESEPSRRQSASCEFLSREGLPIREIAEAITCQGMIRRLTKPTARPKSFERGALLKQHAFRSVQLLPALHNPAL
jgi:hypothetical protein